MKNVYDIKRDENLNFILSDKYINNLNNNILQKEMAVVIHLHYKDTVKNYFKYIANIPESVDIYITVSDKITKMRITECIEYYGIKNCLIVDKNNRGRDISALLVACRNKILEYQYVCFVHDKKEKSDDRKEDIQNWTEGLWENTIGSTEYIYNVKELFSKNERLGVLVPPNPMTDHFSYAITNTWYDNFNLTKNIAEELKLICDISEDKPSITLGTVFWCRVDALRKLFLKKWVYEDFPDEPLAPDGTISHAIERIFAYVAQDAGYYTGNIMTDTYAGKQFEHRNMILTKAFDELDKFSGIGNVTELFNSDLKRKVIRNFCNLYSDIYIYGAGVYGSKSFRMMQAICKTPKAFLVSDGKRVRKDLYGIPILELSEVELNDKCGIILAVSSKYIDEIKRSLDEKKNNLMIYIDK
jgi:lipopolysaccharide biosynthesis protein